MRSILDTSVLLGPNPGEIQGEIAATASANNARLYTRNPSDLVGLDDLLEIVSIS